MAGLFESKYTDEQRDAVAFAYEDRKVRPATRVVALAAAGELEHQGEKLPAFTVTENTVRDLASKLRKKRAGIVSSKLAEIAPRDAIEQLRRRLVNAADALLMDYERTLERKASDADPERLRQITRVVREAAAVPGPNDPRPPAPGAKQQGQREGGETKGGLAGGILHAHRTGQTGAAEPAAQTLPPLTPVQGNTDSSNTETHSSTDTTQNTHDDGSPGSLVHALAARVVGDGGELP
jgi:hypothetical protein